MTPTPNKSDSLDKKFSTLTWLMGIVFTGFFATGSAMLISFGSVKSTVEEDNKRIDYITKDYVPLWFMEGMIQNQNYQTEEIVATLRGESGKVKEINLKYIEFQKTMLNNLSKARGGFSNTTRSMKIEK